jgi:hypothetical protein
MRRQRDSPFTQLRTTCKVVVVAARMTQRCERACFALESTVGFGVGRGRRRQDLDGDRAIDAGVARLVDLAHSAFAKLLQHAIRANEVTRVHGVLLAWLWRDLAVARVSTGERAQAGPTAPSELSTSYGPSRVPGVSISSQIPREWQ